MATYDEMNTLYRDMGKRQRYEMAIREQAQIYATGTGTDAELGQAIVAGTYADIDSVIAAIVTGPNSGTLDDDGALLAAVQAAWPNVSAALYTDAA